MGAVACLLIWAMAGLGETGGLGFLARAPSAAPLSRLSLRGTAEAWATSWFWGGAGAGGCSVTAVASDDGGRRRMVPVPFWYGRASPCGALLA